MSHEYRQSPHCGCMDNCAVEMAVKEAQENAASAHAALESYAHTLAVHVEGHFAMPTDSSREICKKWARTVLDHKLETASIVDP